MSDDTLSAIRQNEIVADANNNLSRLTNAYRVASIKKARHLYMLDLIREKVETTATGKYSINSIHVKKDVIAEFCQETGLHWNTANEYFKEASNDVGELIGAGAVLAQVLNLNMGLVEDAQINVGAAEKGSSEMSQAINAYVNTLKNVSDIIGKLQLYDVNKEKNVIQRERTKAETALGAAAIAMNLDGTPDEKRAILKNAFQNKKSIRDLVNQVRAKKGESEDHDDVSHTDFYGEEVETEDDSGTRTT